MHFTKSGGALGTSGSVAFTFTRMGEFKIKNSGLNIEDLELDLIDYGLEEIGEDADGNIIIRTAFNEFGHMSKALEEKGIEVSTAELTRIPMNTMELPEEQAQDVLKLVDKLEQDEDVQKVYHNLK
jgi:transcriptional/translational regulatory protein YebC/TACO1